MQLGILLFISVNENYRRFNEGPCRHGQVTNVPEITTQYKLQMETVNTHLNIKV